MSPGKNRARRMWWLPVLGAGAVLLLLIWTLSHGPTLVLWLKLRPEFSLHRLENDRGRPEFLHRRTGIIFVWIPGGEFTMGSPDDGGRAGREERPQHRVVLGDFLLAKYEVSQAQWSSVSPENPSQFEGENMPVETVTWTQCVRFCEQTGLLLPTEAQWEYACRAGSSRYLPFGDEAELRADYAAFGGLASTLPVESLLPNRYGLHHMHGNVPEWCRDIYRHDFYSQPAATEEDPWNDGKRGERVIRGGSWTIYPGHCRCAARRGGEPDLEGLVIGFRPAYYPLP